MKTLNLFLLSFCFLLVPASVSAQSYTKAQIAQALDSALSTYLQGVKPHHYCLCNNCEHYYDGGLNLLRKGRSYRELSETEKENRMTVWGSAKANQYSPFGSSHTIIQFYAEFRAEESIPTLKLLRWKQNDCMQYVTLMEEKPGPPMEIAMVNPEFAEEVMLEEMLDAELPEVVIEDVVAEMDAAEIDSAKIAPVAESMARGEADTVLAEVAMTARLAAPVMAMQAAGTPETAPAPATKAPADDSWRGSLEVFSDWQKQPVDSLGQSLIKGRVFNREQKAWQSVRLEVRFIDEAGEWLSYEEVILEEALPAGEGLPLEVYLKAPEGALFHQVEVMGAE
ncbi:MAG: hypothetical protein AAFR61_08450 [Bacteroidota bacterium]